MSGVIVSAYPPIARDRSGTGSRLISVIAIRLSAERPNSRDGLGVFTPKTGETRLITLVVDRDLRAPPSQSPSPTSSPPIFAVELLTERRSLVSISLFSAGPEGLTTDKGALSCLERHERHTLSPSAEKGGEEREKRLLGFRIILTLDRGTDLRIRGPDGGV